MTYNYIFIGSGISTLISAYRIKQHNPDASIAILEKGKPLLERICPISGTDKNVYIANNVLLYLG